MLFALLLTEFSLLGGPMQIGYEVMLDTTAGNEHSTIPNLVSQIQKRGREFEKSIRIDYLQGLNNRYEEWISNYKGPLMVIDGDTCKFGNNPHDFQQITDMIDAQLYGLFPLENNTL